MPPAPAHSSVQAKTVAPRKWISALIWMVSRRPRSYSNEASEAILFLFLGQTSFSLFLGLVAFSCFWVSPFLLYCAPVSDFLSDPCPEL